MRINLKEVFSFILLMVFRKSFVCEKINKIMNSNFLGWHDIWIILQKSNAKVAELVDAHDSKSCSFESEGSIPSFGTS